MPATMHRSALMLRALVLLALLSPFCVGASAALAQQRPASAVAPDDVVRWIYREAAKGKAGDQAGGSFLFPEKGLSGAVFSRDLVLRWADGMRRKSADDIGLDFDPVSDSQDPSIGRVEANTTSMQGDRASVTARFGSIHNPAEKPSVVHYDFVREGGVWKIDNIRGGRDPAYMWTLREIIAEWSKPQ